jgi:hypothetical protein
MNKKMFMDKIRSICNGKFTYQLDKDIEKLVYEFEYKTDNEVDIKLPDIIATMNSGKYMTVTLDYLGDTMTIYDVGVIEFVTDKLTEESKSKKIICTCDSKVLFNYGCKCGAIDKERI